MPGSVSRSKTVFLWSRHSRAPDTWKTDSVVSSIVAATTPSPWSSPTWWAISDPTVITAPWAQSRTQLSRDGTGAPTGRGGRSIRPRAAWSKPSAIASTVDRLRHQGLHRWAVSAGPPTSEPESDVRRLVTRPPHPCWGSEVRPVLDTMDARAGRRLRTMVGAGDGGTAAGGDGPDGRRSLSVRQAAFIGVGPWSAPASSRCSAPRARWPAQRSGSRSSSRAGSPCCRATPSPSSERAIPRRVGSSSTSSVAGGTATSRACIAWLLLAVNAIITAMVAVSFGSYASDAVADNDDVGQAVRGDRSCW